MEITEQGFPYCPACHGILHWDNDFSKSELGLADEESPEGSEVVHCLTCPDCEREWYYTTDYNKEEFTDVSRY